MIVEAFNKKLNPKIWDHDNNLYKDVRDKVLEIVTYFNDYVTIPLNILDIQIVGSNASYNWNENSDLDIHIICDFSIYNYADIEILKALYNAEKTQFNNSYDIVIKGIEAEVYVEDVNQTTISNGIYSLKDGWIKFPNKLDDIVVQDISSDLNKWVQLITNVKDGNSQDGAQELLDKIYMIRKNSLAVDGEYGAGNLLFKALRAKGYIQDLRNLRDKDISKKLTLEDLRFNKSTKLFEANRTQLINKSKNSEKGRQRYNRRVKSRMANAVRDFNSIDMNKLFKDDILAVDVTVHGETDDYKVRMSFGGFLEILRDQIEKAGKLDLRAITRALVIGFNKDDVYIHCTCPDFKYRFDYYATRNIYNSGEPQNIPSKITNPRDSLGSGCKHILLLLSNTAWLIKVASVINNYIKYTQKNMQRAYTDIIYPAIYGKEYEEPVQLSIFDKDDLDTDETTIDKSNQYGRTSTQFKKGNTQGVRFAPNNSNDDQITIDDEFFN